MTWRTWTRMPGAAALAALLAAGAVAGQEPETGRPWEGRMGGGLVLDEDGGWRPPTPADALGILRRDPNAPRIGAGVRRDGPAMAVLRQEYEYRPAAELDGLANAMADLLLSLESPEHMTEEYRLQGDILGTLAAAARGGDHTPHPGSFDALVRIYETIVAEALASGGTDPVEELVRRSGRGRGTLRLRRALRSIFNADRAGRGADYLLAVIAASDPPTGDRWPRLPASLWCEAANIVRSSWSPPQENPRRADLPDLALDDEWFYQRCGYH